MRPFSVTHFVVLKPFNRYTPVIALTLRHFHLLSLWSQFCKSTDAHSVADPGFSSGGGGPTYYFGHFSLKTEGNWKRGACPLCPHTPWIRQWHFVVEETPPLQIPSGSDFRMLRFMTLRSFSAQKGHRLFFTSMTIWSDLSIQETKWCLFLWEKILIDQQQWTIKQSYFVSDVVFVLFPWTSERSNIKT